jgi:hypothetical protein
MDETEAALMLNPGQLGVRARIRQALKSSGLSQSEASRRAEAISPKAIRQLMSNACLRGARPRDPEVQNAFAAVLKVESNWLWYGSWVRPDQRVRQFQTADAQPDSGPLVEQDGAGESDGRPDMLAATLQSTPLNLPVRPDPKAYAIPVSDGFWEPLARPGDCLLVSPSYPPTVGGLVYIRMPSGGGGVYRLAATTPDSVVLTAPNGMPVSLLSSLIEMHKISAIIYA